MIHDATAPGGLMYHGVPMAGEFSHGIINYNPKFFWSLAEANGYDIVRFWGWSADETVPLSQDLAAQIRFNRPLVAQGCSTCTSLATSAATQLPFEG